MASHHARLAIAGAVAAGVSLSPLPAAADWIVQNNSDSGTGSLRWAIEQANANPGFDVVRFGSLLDRTIRPVTPLPTVLGDMALFGWVGGQFPTDPAADRGYEIDGSLQAGPKVGLRIAGTNTQVAGFAITNYHDAQGGGIGILLEGAGALIRMNFVGTNRQGNGPVPNDTGIVVRGSDNTIGDEDAGRFSLVSGNGVGISIEGSAAARTLVRQTWIGLDRTGAALPNTSHGIRISDANDTRIGAAAYPENKISFNGGAGVAVVGSLALGNDVVKAVFRGNAGLAVDLGADGPTPNDAGDGDTGPNWLQNFPVLTAVNWNGSLVEVQGFLESIPLQTYRISFHAGPSAEPWGHVRAERSLGSINVTADAAGHAPFTFVTGGLDAVNRWVGVTATNSGSVSEMSPAMEVIGSPPNQRVFVVNTADSLNQGPCTAARCSLAEAVAAANSSANLVLPDAIHFAIPGGGPHQIVGYFTLTDPVIVDGYTQPGSSPNTIPFGAGGTNAVLQIQILCGPMPGNGTGVALSDDSVVRGLAIRGCGGSQVFASRDNVVEGNFLGTDAAGGNVPATNQAGIIVGGDGNRIGGTSPGSRNLISGNSRGIVVFSSSNAIEGNLIGTTRDGAAALGNRSSGISLESAAVATTPTTGNVIGGTGSAGNVISGQGGSGASNAWGVELASFSSRMVVGNTIRGNYIGLNATGTAALPNRTGISLSTTNVTGNVVEANVISGNSGGGFGSGIYLLNNSSNTIVRGNWIGTGPGGAGDFPNQNDGVSVFGNSTGNVIEGNVIRANGRAGIAVADTSTARITANRIENNDGLGIDLGLDGVTPNDPGDADSGPNQLLNFPVVTAAGSDGSVTASLQAAPNQPFTIEFFASAAADPSGHGEGGRYLGAAAVTTNALGNANVTAVVSPASAGEWVTATTVKPAGVLTSEFGPGAVVSNSAFAPAALVVDAVGNGVLEPNEAVVIAPAWRNASAAAATVTGLASSFTGIPGLGWTLSDAIADYGTVAAGDTATCTSTGDCYVVAAALSGPRPADHIDGLLDEALSQGSLHRWRLHVGRSFVDMPVTSPFYRFVETLLHRGVTAGCSGGSFCPDGAVLRGAMAVFVLAAHVPTLYPPACVAGQETFADVPASSPYCRFVEELARRQVVAGCGGGNYCPQSSVTREQMAVFLLLTREGAGYAPPACGATPRFADVPASSPFCRWIEELARRGITGGCTQTLFCPVSIVARDQMAVFLTTTFGLTLYGP